ncbi:response regulator [bacterium]|nr:response regulator [bacterium]
MGFSFLLVDDSSIVRKSLKKTFALTDLEISEIHEATNGQEALEVLNSEWVDLVFLDVNMPVMNGIEFMEALVANDELKDTQVIVVSTEGSQERLDRLKELGVVGYLRKPFAPEELVEKVNEILRGVKNG